MEREIFESSALKTVSETPTSTDRLEGSYPVEKLSAVPDAEWKDRVTGIPTEAVETAKALCDPNDTSLKDLITALDHREKDFRNHPTGPIDMGQVNSYLDTVYGKDTTGNSLKSVVDTPALSTADFEKMVSGSTDPAIKQTILKDTIKLALATGSPREVNSLMKSLETGKLSLITAGGNLTTSGKLLLESALALKSNVYTTSTGINVSPVLKTEVKNFIEAPKDPAKKTAFGTFMSAKHLNATPATITATAGAIKTTEWETKVKKGKDDAAKTLFKGIFNTTSGALKSMAPSMRGIVARELSSLNKTPFVMLGKQLNEISEIAKIARGTKALNEKVKDIDLRLNNDVTKKNLGELQETVDANVSLENPKHKEVLARRSVEILNQIAKDKGFDLTALRTPWNKTWEEEFRNATTAINTDGNIMPVADLLGRVAIFSEKKELRDQAEKELKTLLTSLLLHQGANKEDVLKKIQDTAPGSYGTEMKKLFTDTNAGNLGANPENTSVQLAALVFSRLENIEYYRKINNKAANTRTPEEAAQLEFLISRLHNSDGSVFDVTKTVNPAQFNERQQEQIGDQFQRELQANAIAEALGLNANDPKVAEIMAMTKPGEVMATENNKFNRINNSENLRKVGIAGIAAAGAVMAFTPGLAPIGAAILIGTGIAKIGLVVKNVIESSKRIGFKQTMKNMWTGFKDSITYLFDKEHTVKEKLVYGAAFLASAGRMFLPGVGSAIYSVVEAGAAWGSEKHLSDQRKHVAAEIAGIRSVMENTNYATTSGRTVNAVNVWNEYKTRRASLLEEKRAEAIRTGQPTRPLESYSDKEVLAVITENKYKADPDANKEKDFLEVMNVVVTKQEAVKEMNEKYNKAAGMWGAVFAGSMVGALVGGAARITVGAINAHPTQNPTENPENPQNPTNPENPTNPNPTNPSGPTEPTQPVNEGGVLLRNGRVYLPGDAMDGQPGFPASQTTLEGGINNYNNYDYGAYDMAAWKLDQDLVANGITRPELDKLGDLGIHRLAYNYTQEILGGNPTPDLSAELQQLGTPEALSLAEKVAPGNLNLGQPGL